MTSWVLRPAKLGNELFHLADSSCILIHTSPSHPKPLPLESCTRTHPTMPPKIKADIKSLDFEEVLEAIGKGNYKDDAKVIRRAFGQTRRNVAAADAAAARGQVPNRANTSSPSAYSPSGLSAPNPVYPTGPASPSAAATMTTNDQAQQIQDLAPRKPPFFFREDYAGFIVKGNFMTLAARPHLVEQGEWLAHQSK